MSGVKCTNKLLSALAITLVIVVGLTGCAGLSYSSKYSVSSNSKESKESTVYPTFASDLCVAASDINTSDVDMSEPTSAGLFDLDNRETLYAKDVNIQVHPASLTKVMTAYVALKYGNPEQTLVAGSDVYVTESGAQKLGLKEGDKMSLSDALKILLIYSANDVANMIASNISGSIDEFVSLMNEEALRIGATNTHFENPNGLTADEHYSTAYDMYLIFNAAMGDERFKEIIATTDYAITYYDSKGNEITKEVSNTNLYLKGDKQPPSGVTVIGGKTGTTNAAGHCLILFARDSRSKPYIAVIMRDTDNASLYSDMTSLLNEIVN